MVHSVRPMLAHRPVCVSDLSIGLAADTAAAYFRHRRARSFKFDQRAVFSPREAASRTTRDLTCRFLPIDYPRLNKGIPR